MSIPCGTKRLFTLAMSLNLVAVTMDWRSENPVEAIANKFSVG